MKNMGVVFCGAILLLVSVTPLAMASQDISMSFDANPQLYEGSNANSWISESTMISDNDFNITTHNNLSGTLTNAYLAFAIPYAAQAGSWEVVLGGVSYDWSDFSETGKHDVLPGHGVYGVNGGQSISRWFNYGLGDISGNGSVVTSIQINGAPSDFMLHFDAYGYKPNGKSTFAAFSHDANYITPEPISSALFLLGGGVIAALKFRKKKNLA